SFETLRNGENYVVENFFTDFHYSDKEIRFDKLDLKTSDSYLNGHLVFSYDSAQDLKDFTNRVQWDAEFKDGSRANFKDIRYFVDNFDKNSTVEVLGKVSGTLNQLILNDLQLNGEGVFMATQELRLTDMVSNEQLEIFT